MSGLAFQKMNGQGTQMQALIDAVKEGNKPDLYKMAKEFASGYVLTKIVKSWEIGINENAINDLLLEGLYFGKFIINHNSQDVGDSDNSRKRSQSFLKYGNEVVARTMVIVHGDDILSWGTTTTEHYGFATSLHLHKLEEDEQPQHGVQVSFIGYKLTNNDGFEVDNPVVVVNPNLNGTVALSAQDLTSAGYTYQWSATTGTGTWVNPTSPNSVFIPDGNGNYVLQLVVSDLDGNVSQPVNIPVQIAFQKVTLVNTGLISLNFGVDGEGVNFDSVEPDGERAYFKSVGSHILIQQVQKDFQKTCFMDTISNGNLVNQQESINPIIYSDDYIDGIDTVLEYKNVHIDNIHPIHNLVSGDNVVSVAEANIFQHNMVEGETFNIYPNRIVDFYSESPFKLMNGDELIQIADFVGFHYEVNYIDLTGYHDLKTVDV